MEGVKNLVVGTKVSESKGGQGGITSFFFVCLFDVEFASDKNCGPAARVEIFQSY